MKKYLNRIFSGFYHSAFAGLLVFLIIDVCLNHFVESEGFVSIPPAFLERFATPVIAAYANIIVYGLIGATFAGMTFIFEVDRLGFVIQYLIYFLSTGAVLTFITMYLWKLQTVPTAFFSTLAGYAVTFIIVGMLQYRMLRQDIAMINEIIEKDD